MISAREAQRAELVGHPVGRPLHLARAARIGADARNAEKLAQFLLEPRRLRRQVFVNRSHKDLPRCDNGPLSATTTGQYNGFGPG